MACALEDRRFTQPMKYFLTESLLQIVYMHVCSTSAYYFLRPAYYKEGAEKIVNGLRKHIEDQRMLESLRSADEPWPQQITMHNHFDHELDVCSHDRYQGKPVVKMAEIEDGAVGEPALLTNFHLLKAYIPAVVDDKGVPNLADHKVAFLHISATYNLHPQVRTKRGGKAEVKDWAHAEAVKLKGLLSALQRLTRRTFDAKNTKTLILKKLFAQRIGWMAHPEPEPDSRAVVPADEADAGASDADSILLGLSPSMEDGEAPEAGAPAAIADAAMDDEDDDLMPRNLDAELEGLVHQILCEKQNDSKDLDDDDMAALLAASDSESVPDPQTYLGPEALAELEAMERERADELFLLAFQGELCGIRFQDRAPLLSERLALPDELQDLLELDEDAQGNDVREKQKQVKASHQQKHHEVKAAAKAKAGQRKRKAPDAAEPDLETRVTPEGRRTRALDAAESDMRKKPRGPRNKRSNVAGAGMSSKPNVPEPASVSEHDVPEPASVSEPSVPEPASVFEPMPEPESEEARDVPEPAPAGVPEPEPASEPETAAEAAQRAARAAALRRAADRRQVMADNHAAMIRNLPNLVDLQPPLGFTSKCRSCNRS
ncbi:unnamed protein product [Symbiodinium necroappetens]|uniref:Uncharacterized protein n=1 Tax=Symbiodinium necroappetens TaxID=1628268 RepID=A0A812ISF1_9DINO|nr:unnamed protein product [Symbiodinium necroappetens]